MTSLWIILSTKWDLSSVQASLNVIISALGTIGLWSFTRYWWRRGSQKVIRDKANVPLSALLTVGGPGDSWDVMLVLKRQLFAKDNSHVLIQLVVVLAVTLACAFAGPIAKFSLKNGLTITRKPLSVLETVKGGGAFGNMLFANVLWNDTAQSLADAEFPDNQLLDYLPPVTTPPWTYVAAEWNPTWAVSCKYFERVYLPNLNGSGTGNMFNALDAFPAFRDTYDPFWLNSSEYRIMTDFNTWENWSDPIQFTDAFFYVLAQSNPELDDRMLHNNETLRISLSVLHAHRFQVLYDVKNSLLGDETWRPVGPVADASYTRAECNIARTNQAADPDHMPWPWTNDTDSIVSAYRTYYNVPFAYMSSKKLPVIPQTAREMFRFYQVYMASINTFQGNRAPRVVSVKVRTVELSVIFLVALIVLTLLTAYNSIRYGIFVRRYNQKIKDMYIPDSKIEWMIHAVKSLESGGDLEMNLPEKTRRDSEHLRTATFGHLSPDTPNTDSDLQKPKLARVMSMPSSVCNSRPASKISIPRSPGQLTLIAEDLPTDQDVRFPSFSRSVSSSKTITAIEDSGRCSPNPMTKCYKTLSETDVDHRFLTVGGRFSFDQSGRASPVTVHSSSASIQKDVEEIGKDPLQVEEHARPQDQVDQHGPSTP